MAQLFPHPVPYDEGMLDVGDGQLVHWVVSGNPDGKPVVALHGGPGSGMSSGRAFDPARYRLVRFDQRGCGRSTPSVADLDTDLSTNTTHHLIADIERLREHLGIDRWVVWGGSWGVTLALAYAQRFPDRVTAMVLISVTMTRPQDVHWLYHEVGRYFPVEWHRFSERGGNAPDLIAAYDQLLNRHHDPAVRRQAARDWRDWEDAVLSLEEGWAPSGKYEDPDATVAFARLCAHYFSHAAWLESDELIRNAGRLAGIPAVLIHGRLDLGSPADVPWLLSRAWPEAELHYFGGGHTGSEEARDIMAAALTRFAQE
ncbi:proline iminopeptidase [Nakamurella panacisegetis]|uniref:Proline iminopeptidase n=1 Tax=Nakamurella panacisegetis TaxID=1090615 RepID=A0A1H0KGD5_9ACTN|nr:prolyl aminopeptidase [Nakamurella panacisegetis]SDO54830.1 proline iminopeptidase [Nakamurella panacisegetis]